MIEIAELKEIISKEDKYELVVTIPKHLYHAYTAVFRAFEQMAKDLHYKSTLAEARAEHKRAEWDKEREKSFQEKISEMRNLYKGHLQNGLSHKEAMKDVTRQFREYSWLRRRFKKELESQRDIKVIRLGKGGLTSAKISAMTGIPASTVRDILNGRNKKKETSMTAILAEYGYPPHPTVPENTERRIMEEF